MGGGTLSAIGGSAVQLQLLAGTLGQERGRTAAVTVDRIDTAQAQHKLSHLIVGKTSGEGSLTAVIHDDDNAAVSLDTHKRTGSTVGCIVVHAILILAVLDQEAKVSRDNLLLPAGDGILSGADLGLGHIGGTGNAILLVKIDDKTGLSAGGLTLAVGKQLAIQNHVAQRLADQLRMLVVVSGVIPAQRNIHGSDHIAVAIGLGIGSLLGHDLHTIVVGFGNHALKAGNHLGVRIVDVDLHDVCHLAVGAGVVVQDDLGFGDTGRQNIVGLVDDIVVVIMGGVDDFRRREVLGAMSFHAHKHHRGFCRSLGLLSGSFSLLNRSLSLLSGSFSFLNRCLSLLSGSFSFLNRCLSHFTGNLSLFLGTVFCFSSECAQGHAQDHHNCQKHRQQPSLQGVMHFVFLLLEDCI